MPDEPHENEPAEYDPEAEFRNPASDSITIPQVETDESEVPRDVKQTFWIVVLVVNAAVLAVSLGVILVVFTGDLTRGGTLLAGGLVLFGLAYRRYRRFIAEENQEGTEEKASGEETDSSTMAETNSSITPKTDSSTTAETDSIPNAKSPGSETSTESTGSETNE